MSLLLLMALKHSTSNASTTKITFSTAKQIMWSTREANHHYYKCYCLSTIFIKALPVWRHPTIPMSA